MQIYTNCALLRQHCRNKVTGSLPMEEMMEQAGTETMHTKNKLLGQPAQAAASLQTNPAGDTNPSVNKRAEREHRHRSGSPSVRPAVKRKPLSYIVHVLYLHPKWYAEVVQYFDRYRVWPGRGRGNSKPRACAWFGPNRAVRNHSVGHCQSEHFSALQQINCRPVLHGSFVEGGCAQPASKVFRASAWHGRVIAAS